MSYAVRALDISRIDILRPSKDDSYRELLYTYRSGQVMINMKDWIILPERGKPRELSADEAYPRLFGLLQDLEKERGRQLTDKQVNALQAFVRSLIDARACIRYYDQ